MLDSLVRTPMRRAMEPGRRPGGIAALATTVALVAGLAACGSESPEARLAEAQENMAEARAEVRGLEARVASKRKAVEKARNALEHARGELQEAETELAEARARIDERATDVALFRSVQTALLEQETLSDFAIRATVEAGVVTLHGRVQTPSQRDQAVEIAESVTGVEEVVSEIRVRDARTAGR